MYRRTQVASELWTCVQNVPKQSNGLHFEHGLHHSFGHVKYVPKQSTAKHFEHRLHHSFGHVWSMYGNSPFRSTLNMGYITALDMCEVCTEAVHCVALWTRVTSQLWTCVKYVRKQSTAGYTTASDMCEVCTEAVHPVALWTRVTSQLWTCVKHVPKQSTP